MATWKRGKGSLGPEPKRRRKQALVLLEQDLASGRLRVAGKRSEEPMSDTDRKRIITEMENIKKKI